MENYLVSFHPLCSTRKGRQASKRFRIPPYIDGSCRREPNLDHEYPSITALCRAGKFAPKLRKGDRVFYMTVKGLHHGGVEGWAMIAGLQVLKVFKSHEAAAEFYTRRQKRLKLPTNCVIPSNPPLPAKYTTGLPDRGIRWRNQWTKSVEKTFSPTVKNWDKQYQERAKNHPAFVVTRPIVPCQLRTPKILTRANLEEVFGRLPITQAPNKISDEEFSALLAHL